MTDLVPGQSGGGKGKGRLPEPVERVIHELLQKRFLTKQKRSLAAFHREVTQVCKAQKLRVPARNTVALRIASLDPRKVIRRREGQDAARDLQGVGGEPPAVTAPLEQVQIDHTVIDLIVVDDRDRQPIGRPYLTLAIDVFTRCVLGMVVTLEAPSAPIIVHSDSTCHLGQHLHCHHPIPAELLTDDGRDAAGVAGGFIARDDRPTDSNGNLVDAHLHPRRT